jgi:hypothetical protein
MIDIERLLDQTARSAEATPSPEVVEADVRRARSALLQRRRRRAVWTSVASTVAVAAVIGAAVVIGADRDAGTPTAQPNATQSQGQAPADDGVDLVTYNGEQPSGFIVNLVPEGWYIQKPDHGAYSLAIARDGDTSSPDAFVGKLVVGLLSSDASVPTHGEPVDINGREGVISPSDGGVTTLTFPYQDGRYVQIQAWSMADLGWSNDQLVRFAEGITVTASAQAGVG